MTRLRGRTTRGLWREEPKRSSSFFDDLKITVLSLAMSLAMAAAIAWLALLAAERGWFSRLPEWMR